MPRINVEDSFWKDERVIALCERIGRFKALGTMLVAWKTAQGFWVRDKLIPDEHWKIAGLPDSLFEVGLAARCPEGFELSDGTPMAPGIHVRGSEEQFAWMRSKIRNGAKGGRTKASNRNAGGVLSQNSITPENNNLPLAIASDAVATASDGYPPTPSPSPSLKKRREKKDLSVLPLLAVLWNENRGRLAAVVACGSSRRRAVNSAWREHPDELFWVGVIQTIASNTFLNGERPSEKNPNWKASFDWMLKPDNVHKILEGNYEQKKLARESRTITSLADIQAIEKNSLGGHR